MPIKQLLNDFGRDTRGAIAIIFAASLIVLVMTVGLAIDGARAYGVSAKVASALDSAALAAGRMLDSDSSDSAIQDAADDYFKANWQRFPINGVSTKNFTTSIERKKYEVTVSVDVAVGSTFAQIAGIPAFSFNRSSTIVYEPKKIEVAMALDVTGSMNDDDKLQGMRDAARDVIDALLSGNFAAGSVRIALAPYSATVNAGGYGATASGGVSKDGCVFERSGTKAFTDAPYSSEVLGAMPDPAAPSNARYACPPAAILPLSDDRSLLRSTVQSYEAKGWTAGHIGLAWAWYLLSPDWTLWPADRRGLSYSDPRAEKSIILMTDGMFNTAYQSGVESSEDPTAVGSSAYQALQLCAAVKARGITLYTVAFKAPVAAEDVLRACSSPSSYFNAANNSELRDAFRTIAGRIGALRVAR